MRGHLGKALNLVSDHISVKANSATAHRLENQIRRTDADIIGLVAVNTIDEPEESASKEVQEREEKDAKENLEIFTRLIRESPDLKSIVSNVAVEIVNGALESELDKKKLGLEKAKAMAIRQTKDIESLLLATRKICEQQVSEIAEIQDSARKLAIERVTGAFTDEFESHSLKLAGDARPWLIATTVFVVTSLASAFLFATGITIGSVDSEGILRKSAAISQYGPIQTAFARIAFIGLLVGAGAWCGRIYRALRHQSANFKQRALSIKTLQAFRDAIDDPVLKDQLVAEAAAAVFGSVSTGLADQKDGKSSSQHIDILRRPIPVPIVRAASDPAP